MIAGRALLLEAALVLLVDDDQPEVAGRGEHGAPRPDDDLDLPGRHPPPVPAPLGVGQVAVQDGHVPAPPLEPVDRLRGEGDFGDEDDDLFALGD